ncbi:MAG: TolC family protein [Candidatus Eremiobacteraeota bacterium]|nr:TolC family protein [Candidatus Eremiobacteraeota bacterium]MCW5867926.1 TolC family protein [Candidatus Eremiobacteraeota bacterium]
MLRHIWIGALVLALPWFALAQPSGPVAVPLQVTPQEQLPLTLEQAVSEALNHNLELLAKHYDLNIAEARQLTAAMHPNPTLSLGADHLDFVGTGFNEINTAGPSEYSGRFDFTFEGGGKRARRMEVAELARQVAEFQLREAARQLILEVDNAYIEVLLARGNLSVAQQNRSAFARITRISRERVRAGDLARVELMRTQLAELQYDNTVILSEARLRTAKQKLLLLMGRNKNVQEDIELEGSLPRPPVNLAIPELEQIALTQRPDYLALIRDQKRSEASIRLEEANGKPNYIGGFEYRRQQGFAGKGNMLGFFFSMPIPIFDTNEGEVRRARHEYDQVIARARALEAEIKQELASASQQLQAAERTVRQIESHMLTQARQVLDTMEYSYRGGHATLVELLDAQRSYNDIMVSYNEALAEYARSRFLLYSITGQGGSLEK